jgi:hypothetical protein
MGLANLGKATNLAISLVTVAGTGLAEVDTVDLAIDSTREAIIIVGDMLQLHHMAVIEDGPKVVRKGWVVGRLSLVVSWAIIIMLGSCPF